MKTKNALPYKLMSTFFLGFFLVLSAYSQEKGHITRAIIIDGDTVPFFILKEVSIVSSYALLTKEEIKKNQKLIKNIKKTLPYAKLARKKLEELTIQMEKIPESKKAAFIKKAEDQIDKEFAKELKNLTISQGIVLIKLIDRETGKSSFDIVKELRGSFRAFFYQTFAKVFGLNLKTKFNPSLYKEDELIERICRSIELNQI